MYLPPNSSTIFTLSRCVQFTHSIGWAYPLECENFSTAKASCNLGYLSKSICLVSISVSGWEMMEYLLIVSQAGMMFYSRTRVCSLGPVVLNVMTTSVMIMRKIAVTLNRASQILFDHGSLSYYGSEPPPRIRERASVLNWSIISNKYLFLNKTFYDVYRFAT